MMRNNQSGFTLIELLVVIGMLGIIAGFAVSSLPDIFRSWRLKDAANQILEDVRDAQTEAMRLGDYASVDNAGTRQFRQQAVFLKLDVANNSYEAWQWIDDNNNGYPEASGTDRLTQIYSRNLPEGSSFSSGPALKSACSSSSDLDPASPDKVSFNSKGYPPCDGNNCIMFDARGVINDKGNIYLSDGKNSWALNSLEPGIFRLCRWNGSAWN